MARVTAAFPDRSPAWDTLRGTVEGGGRRAAHSARPDRRRPRAGAARPAALPALRRSRGRPAPAAPAPAAPAPATPAPACTTAAAVNTRSVGGSVTGPPHLTCKTAGPGRARRAAAVRVAQPGPGRPLPARAAQEAHSERPRAGFRLARSGPEAALRGPAPCRPREQSGSDSRRGLPLGQHVHGCGTY